MLSASIRYLHADAEPNPHCPVVVQHWLPAEVDDVHADESKSPRLAVEKALAEIQALPLEPEEAKEKFIHSVVSRGFSA